MIMKVRDKDIIGYSRADGVHWYWGDQEVAVIDEATGDIEWVERKFNFPADVVDAIIQRKPQKECEWRLEARHVRTSTTQGYIIVLIDGKAVGTYGDDYELVDGRWESKSYDKHLASCAVDAFKTYEHKVREIMGALKAQ